MIYCLRRIDQSSVVLINVGGHLDPGLLNGPYDLDVSQLHIQKATARLYRRCPYHYPYPYRNRVSEVI